MACFRGVAGAVSLLAQTSYGIGLLPSVIRTLSKQAKCTIIIAVGICVLAERDGCQIFGDHKIPIFLRYHLRASKFTSNLLLHSSSDAAPTAVVCEEEQD